MTNETYFLYGVIAGIILNAVCNILVIKKPTKEKE